VSHTSTRRSFPILALNLAIVLLVAGGTAAYGVMSNTVTLTVEGESQTIRTFGSSVSELLDAKNVDVRSEDKISLDPTHQLSDGDEIKVAFAKPVTLSVDGDVSEHTVYDATFGDAFDDLGVDVPEDAYVSEKPNAELSRTENTLIVSTNKDLVIIADGKDHEISTTAPTVGRALAEVGVSLGTNDEIKPSIFSFVEADQTIKVVRIKTVTKTETLPVKYDVDVKKDSDALKGEVDVVQAGANGEKREKVELVYADGEVRDRTVVSRDMVRQPITQVESHGTKAPPSSTSDGVWDKIAQCESGGNWSINTGNGYYGGLQFSAATWKSVGGPGLPHQSSRAVQIKYAKILQARSGWGQWGCAHARFN